MILVQGSLSGHEVFVKIMAARGSSGEVAWSANEQILDEQVVLNGVAEEDRRVDVGIVKGAGVGLVFDERRTVDAEDLQRQSSGTAEPRVGPGMRRAVREADQRVVLAGCGVDALCVLGGNLVEDLDLASDQPIAFSMRVTDGTAGAFGCNRCSDIPLGLGDHRL